MPKDDELILCVRDIVVRREGYRPGFNPRGPAVIAQLMDRADVFLVRRDAENDPAYRQVIPYLVVTIGGAVFAYQRSADHAEIRLALDRSIGIGGHCNFADCEGAGRMPGLLAAARRELNEEVLISPGPRGIALHWAGVLLDDSTPVGRVHLGMVAEVIGASSCEPAPGSKWPRAGMVSPAMLGMDIDSYETWSRMLIRDYLCVVTERDRGFI